jgi:SAM-dependent methyltransferase
MTMTPEMESLKTKLKATWMAGDYGHFAQYLMPGAMKFFDGLGIAKGERVLDLGCGAGQLSFPAAHAGAEVTGIDIATNLIEQARTRARDEGLNIDFEEGDAEDVAHEDSHFDVVFSLIGAMFAPRPEKVASEMIRLCRPGGRIAMGNWTGGGFVGKMFKATGKHVPPPPIMPSPVLWGDESTVVERFGDNVTDLRLERKMYPLEYPFPPSEVVEFFRAYYGPINRAFTALDADGQQALRHDLEALWSENNQSSNGGTRVEAEYLEFFARRT